MEDDQFVSHALRLAMELYGMKVQVNSTGRLPAGQRGLEDFDIVVTDIVMPDVEGIELIRNIRSAPSGIPIVAISGGGLGQAQDYLKIATSFGADAVFEKPFDEDRLIEKIEELVA
ncbi:response regulator [Nisaea sp.]|uniref:response regulator n=1 Tax=Nisaea sp. TaxID=2024842 RepID=UPI003B52E40F